MRMAIAEKFYLTLIVPLITISISVSLMAFKGFESNAADFASALRLQGKTNNILSLIQAQDEASKALLIDPSQLETFSARKIEAYDKLKKLLFDLETEAPTDEMHQVLDGLDGFDDQKLKPLDSRILELLFENINEARKLYFREYDPTRKQYEERIRRLVRLADGHVAAENERMRKRNINSLLQICAAFLIGIVGVSIALTHLARQTERSEGNMQSLLGSLNEGLFFFDAEGLIPVERSQAMSRIIPGSEQVRNLQQFFKLYAPDYPQDAVSTSLKTLWGRSTKNAFLGLTSTAFQLPRELILKGERTIRLEYRPIYGTEGELHHVVVVASDVTESLKSKKEASRNAERIRKISRVATAQESYFHFLDETNRLIDRCGGVFDRVSGEGLIQLNRDLHALKSSTSAFEFDSLSAAVHELEDLLRNEEPSSDAVRDLWSSIVVQWKRETEDIEQSLGLGGMRGRVTISAETWERLYQHALRNQDKALDEIMLDAMRKPLNVVLSDHALYISKLAEKSGHRKKVRMEFTKDSANTSFAEMQKLDSTILHIVRNCFDHGIEDSEERRETGKPLEGTIRCSLTRSKGGALRLVIQDDGRGIDGDALAAKAVERGVWDVVKSQEASHQEKIDLIFEPELSTKSKVSTISGRGLGMDTVRSTLQSLGGRIRVSSQANFGTIFEIDLPGIQGAELAVRNAG